MPRGRAGKRKKRQTHVVKEVDEEDLVPHCLIVGRGKIGKSAQDLVHDLRNVMSPNTALKLREKKSNTIKDFLGICAPLKVSHLMTITQTERGPNLRVGRTVGGPTLSFHIESYALARHIRIAAKKKVDPGLAFETSPLVVMNNFEVNSAPRHVKIVAVAFQAMFPALNVRKLQLSSCRRVLLLNYNAELDTIELRHYLIHTAPAGTSRAMRKLLKKKHPDLHNQSDISEILDNASGYATSDSEYEDDDAKVELPYSRSMTTMKEHKKLSIAKKIAEVSSIATSTTSSNQSVVKLSEIGPRMVLRLVKVEAGVFNGEVQYHAFQEKTEDEVNEIREKHLEKEKLKTERKEEQEKNVKRKREIQEEKEKKRKAKKLRRASKLGAEKKTVNFSDKQEEEEEEEEEDSDEEDIDDDENDDE